MVSGEVRFLNQRTWRMASFVKRKAGVPSVDGECGRVGISRAFAACFFLYGFCPTAVTSGAFVAGALMFATVTFVILSEARGALARGAIALEFMHAVVGHFQFWGFAAEILGGLFEKDRASNCF